DRVEFVPITDSTSRLASLRSGDLHMIERVSPTDLGQIREDPRLKVVGVPELGFQVIRLNVANGPKSKAFADVRVRQAVDLAIDRETLVKTVFNNEYIAGNQWISPSSVYYNAKLPVRKRDVARAKQPLREAGQPNRAFTPLVTKARHVADPAERKKLYDQATEILMREVPSIHLWHRRVFTGYSGKVQGFTPYPDGIIRVKGLKLS